MSQFDQIDHFCEGLKPETCKDITYLCYPTLTDAISYTQAFERAHFAQRSRQEQRRSVERSDVRGSRGETLPEPMDSTMVNTRNISTEECRRRNLCFYCKSPDHRIHNCPKKLGQGNARAQQM